MFVIIKVDLSASHFDIHEGLKLKNLLWKDMKSYKAEYYESINLFCSVVYDYLVELYDSGIKNFREFDNYDLFINLFNKDFHNNVMKFLFGEHISFEKYMDEETSEALLFDQTNNIIFDRYSYENVSKILKKINLLSDKRELNPQKMSQNLLSAVIEEKRLENMIKLQQLEKSALIEKQDIFEIIESCVCWIGNKSKEEIGNMYLWEVREGFNRIQIYEQYKLIMSGYYAGTITLSHADKDKLEWVSSLSG